MTDEELLGAIDDPRLRAQTPAVELVRAVLARIDRVEPELNAFITVMRERALADARRVDEARAQGRRTPLDGMPIAIKDNIDVAGVRRTVASRLFEATVPERDAAVVERLRAAGGVIVGKATLHELVYGATCSNPFFGQCRNPWDLERIPGGSSGGSGAALGADLCVAALGSDTGGSVRIPAHVNGVSGLRPTFGAISTRGVFPIAQTFDTVGPMARALRDVAALYAAVAGYDPEDPRAVDHPTPAVLACLDDGVAGLRIGLPREFFWDDLDADVSAAVDSFAVELSALGAELVQISLPGMAEAQQICTQLIRAEALAIHEADLRRRPECFSQDAIRRLQLGARCSGAQVAAATQRMHELARDVRRVFDAGIDLLLTPTAPVPAPRIEGAEMISTTAQLTRLTYPWSVAGLPAASVPCGLTSDGLPIGAQLAARPWADALVLRAGVAVQNATEWHRLRPATVAGLTGAAA